MTNRNKSLLFGTLAVLLVLGMYYINKPYALEFYGHTEKLWAHRVNDLEKLQVTRGEYAGIELDIMYDADLGELDIFHPPKPSTRLYLSSYLKEIPIDQRPYLWLDFKNLNEHNILQVLFKLQQELDRVGYPYAKILIESAYADGIPIFTKEGFTCSYLIAEDLSNNTQEHLQRISELLKLQPEIGISSSYQNYPYLKEAFPNRTKYFWMIDSFLAHGFGNARTLITDPKVKAILIRM